MYALFTTIPFVGHVNPLLRQARELRRRGWRVGIAVHRDLSAHVSAEAPGVSLVDLGALGPLRERLRECEAAASLDPSYTRGALRMMPVLLDLWPSLFDGLRDAIAHDRPDVMVVDIFTAAGFCAAHAAGVPFVANNPALLPAVPLQLLPPAPDVPFVTSGRSIHDMGRWDRASEPLRRQLTRLLLHFLLDRRLSALGASRGLGEVRVPDLIRERPILVNGVFGLEYRRPLPANVHLVGPMQDGEAPSLSADLRAWLADGPPVVYANLGTVAHATASQLTKMAEALAAPGRRTLWVLRGSGRERLPDPLPDGIRMVDWLESPRAVLEHPNVRVFVSHCGINSIYESMMAGTPVVGIPMLSDQRDMAVRVADAGVGLWLDKARFTAGQLRAAIDRVLGDAAFRSRIDPIRNACAAAGGVPRAADLIEAQARVAYSV